MTNKQFSFVAIQLHNNRNKIRAIILVRRNQFRQLRTHSLKCYLNLEAKKWLIIIKLIVKSQFFLVKRQ
jgi:hypothetical protein